jgi:hypothetical protein
MRVHLHSSVAKVDYLTAPTAWVWSSAISGWSHEAGDLIFIAGIVACARATGWWSAFKR